jgi:hypothetical protein
MQDVGIFSGHLVYFTAMWYKSCPFGIFLWPFGIFYGHLVYFTAIWYILWPFGIFYGHLVYLPPILVCSIKKNLATLILCSATRETSLHLLKLHISASVQQGIYQSRSVTSALQHEKTGGNHPKTIFFFFCLRR